LEGKKIRENARNGKYKEIGLRGYGKRHAAATEHEATRVQLLLRWLRYVAQLIDSEKMGWASFSIKIT